MSRVSSSEHRDRHERHCFAPARYPPAAAFRTASIRIGFCAARHTGRERKSDLDQGAADAGCDVVPPTQDTASFRPRHDTAAPMFRAFSPDRRRRTSLRRQTALVALIKINERLLARRRLLRINEPKGPASGKAIAMPKEVPPPSLPLQEAARHANWTTVSHNSPTGPLWLRSSRSMQPLAGSERTAYCRISASLPCPWPW
jgi:hypothetical protein